MTSADRPARRLILITGMSGAGRSSALRALEDMGYEAIDNVPLSLIPSLTQLSPDNPEDAMAGALAIGVDIRSRAFSADPLDAIVTDLRARPEIDMVLVFLGCSDEVLARRFTETRRRHPLATDRPIQDGIDLERAVMGPIRDRADFYYDTSELSGHELRSLLEKQFHLEDSGELAISIVSFSYRRGLPREADLVFDVRFLTNPFYVQELRDLTGQHPDIAAYISADPEFEVFFDRLSELVLGLLPNYRREGKSYLTIAFGCTGGRHRSVFLAEKMASLLNDTDWFVSIVHRDAGIAGPDITSARARISTR